MTALVALLAAAAYGLGDFTGGFAAQRASAWTVAFAAQLTGASAIALLGVLGSARPDGSDLAWAVLAGVGNGVGTAFLYRGLSAGRMAVVAPVSGVGAALVPVVVGTAVGEQITPLAWAGIVLAFPAIWLVARPPASPTGAGPTRATPPAGAVGSGVVDGVLAGLGFGVLFVGLSRVGSDAGLLPLAFNQAVGGLAIMVIATVAGQPWLPRVRRAWLGGISGLLGALATGLFMVTSRGGHLTVTAVVVSLYPAFTVVLAAALLRERVHRTQGVGLVLCAACVALVASA